MGSKFDLKMQKSQVNLENRMKEDFERLQMQIKKRMEKEKSANELAKLMVEDIKIKAQSSNKKADEILEKAREMKRRHELKIYREYRKQIKQSEERKAGE